MEISKKEQNEIVNSLFEKFSKTEVITYDYIKDFLSAILNDEPKYDIFTLKIPSNESSTNNTMDIKYIIQNNIYYKLCRLTEENIDVLMFLVEDRRSAATLILKKLGITDSSKTEDYLIESFSMFNGDENFNSFITRFIMAKVRGTKFQTKTEIDNARIQEKQDKTVQEVTKKKKKKKKDKRSRIQEPQPVKQEEIKEAVEVTSAPNPISSFTPKEPEINSGVDEQIIEQQVSASSIKESEEQVKPLEGQDPTINQIEEVQEQRQEIVNDTIPISKLEPSSPVQEPIPQQEELIPYVECQKRTGEISGTGTIDNFIRACQETKIVKEIQINNDPFYEMYLLLRLGFINKSFYTKDEISHLLGLSIIDIITYERTTWSIIKNILNNRFSNYEQYILSKIN